MSQKLLIEAVAEFAEQYRRRGYDVILEPPTELLPEKVRGYRPDFLARRGNEQVAVEVKSHRSLRADRNLMNLAQAFRQIPGWRLDLAVFDDIEPAAPPPLLSEDEIRSRLAVADKLATDTGDYAGAVLLLWSALEAVLHPIIEPDHGPRPIVAMRLPKFAYSLGLIEKEDMAFLEWLAALRTDVAHGRKAEDISPEAYRRARDLVAQLMETPWEESWAVSTE